MGPKAKQIARAISFLLASAIVLGSIRAEAISLKINGTDFTIDHDARTLVSASGCNPLTQCAFTSNVMLPIPGFFADTNYACYASQHGNITYAGSFNFYPVSGAEVAVTFYNESGVLIPSNTSISFGFTCEGIGTQSQ